MIVVHDGCLAGVFPSHEPPNPNNDHTKFWYRCSVHEVPGRTEPVPSIRVSNPASSAEPPIPSAALQGLQDQLAGRARPSPCSPMIPSIEDLFVDSPHTSNVARSAGQRL